MFDSNRNGFPLTLNLQLFAEGDNGGGGGGNPPASDPAGTTSNQPSEPQPQQPQQAMLWGLPKGMIAGQAVPAVNPLFADSQPAAPAAQQEPQGQTPAVQEPAPTKEVFDFAGRKIEVSDPAVAEALKAVYGDYTNLTRTFTQTSQRLKDLEAQNQALQQALQAIQTPAQAPEQQTPQQPQEPQKTPEELAQEFIDRFYDNPQAALQDMFQQFFKQAYEKELKPIIEPVQKIAEERQYAEMINQLRQKYASDFDQVAPEMQKVLQENGNLLAHGLETVYWVAKGRMAQNQSPPPTPEQFLSDPQFVENHILKNEGIVQKVVSNYLQSKQQQQQQTPTLIGGQPGGQPPTLPEHKPDSVKAAGKLLRKAWGLLQ